MSPGKQEGNFLRKLYRLQAMLYLYTFAVLTYLVILSFVDLKRCISKFFLVRIMFKMI